MEVIKGDKENPEPPKIIQVRAKTYDTIMCDCGHEAPIDFITHDNDGNSTCANCVIEHLFEKKKKSPPKV